MRLLHHILSQSAEKFPNRCACSCQDSSMGYRELEMESNWLANILQNCGVKRGDRVAIHMPKSIYSLVGILAVLKTGACYVPISIGEPLDRVRFILENCGIECALTSPEYYERVESLPLVICLKNDKPIFYLQGKKRDLGLKVNTHAPDSDVESTDIAYILYTSGSTGVPKGVAHTHRSALNFLQWALTTFNIQNTDRLVSHAPLHFDLSVFDVFAAIAAGAETILIPESHLNNPKYLVQILKEKEATIWQSVPSTLIAMMVYGEFARHRYPVLRYVLFAGDVFPVKYLRQLQKISSNAQLVNIYGATETNNTFMYLIPAIPEARTEAYPIGKPIAGVDAVVLGERGMKIAQGEIGELYVHSQTMMVGYWKETSKSYLLEVAPGRWFYKTNDLVKIDQCGDYFFVGRTHDMVKVRGYRVHLKEIESYLAIHPQIRETAVIPGEDEMGGTVLTAFVVVSENSHVAYVDLKVYCSQHLPTYMIPQNFRITTQSLPKTSTGKVDKKELKKML